MLYRQFRTWNTRNDTLTLDQKVNKRAGICLSLSLPLSPSVIDSRDTDWHGVPAVAAGKVVTCCWIDRSCCASEVKTPGLVTYTGCWALLARVPLFFTLWLGGPGSSFYLLIRAGMFSLAALPLLTCWLTRWLSSSKRSPLFPCWLFRWEQKGEAFLLISGTETILSSWLWISVGSTVPF